MIASADAAQSNWALVTGASSGIGAAICKELAKAGWRLILVARDEVRLRAIGDDCARRYNIEYRVITSDLARPDGAAKLAERLAAENLSVSILVNNAGFGVHGAFNETDTDRELELVNVQVRALIVLTKALLPRMLASKDGMILNVASVYSFAPVRNQTVYAACKAFMLSFSESLAEELRGTGVSVTVLCPGITRTEFRTRSGMAEKKSRLAMSAEEVAAIGCRAMFRRKFLSVPGTLNSVYVLASKMLPRTLIASFTRRLNSRRGLEK